MPKITVKIRDEIKSLLEDHQAVTDALHNLGKASFHASMLILNEADNDSTDVGFNHAIAKRALTEQKAWVEKELEKRGIEIQ